ncbi:DNA/RNA helicase domain-containing protein [Tabrizicola sp. BL-A-41-H6]|uniref:DNA/RNA helicase domain-containing protein n=1 Tax=Tabrizicola sp. BL-A-41-H6 TaxID=3421107 RepID=UPI003D66899D
MATKSYFASSVSEFLRTGTEEIVGRLATRVGTEHSGDDGNQIRAWRVQVDLLKNSLRTLDSGQWGIMLELPLLRLGRRIDTIILIDSMVVLIEFKIGSSRFGSADIDQAVDYALCLRDFHSGSKSLRIVPILCAERAPDAQYDVSLTFVDHVSACMPVNAAQLGDVLRSVSSIASGTQLNWRDFDASSYSPTPDIVTAARALYAGHGVKEVGRADAPAEALERTSSRLQEIAENARTERSKVVCFVTGEPGSGKTLLGLELVLSGLAGRVAGEPSALLSGNRPLVQVLQSAISEDARDRLGIKAPEAKRQAQQALRTLLGYLKDHDGPASRPPEHVIVFDEAQRAWDAETGLKLLGRERSEAELFLEILGRLDWACLVCLVGPGQEINRGEGGLRLWGEALLKVPDWTAHVSEQVLRGQGGLSGLLDGAEALEVIVESDLHLRTNLRAHRNSLHGEWVASLLASDAASAAAIAHRMDAPPAYITRSLPRMKSWLEARRRGGHRVGLLASSGATRLIAEGIPPSPRSNELEQVVHWFLRPAGDFRSSNALEVPLSEFVCQGLEVDYAGLAWGNDLIWGDKGWMPRKMRAPRWQFLQNIDAQQFRLNAYRVLLTRARAGTAIYVPDGDIDDPSRMPDDFEGVYRTLRESGRVDL